MKFEHETRYARKFVVSFTEISRDLTMKQDVREFVVSVVSIRPFFMVNSPAYLVSCSNLVRFQ